MTKAMHDHLIGHKKLGRIRCLKDCIECLVGVKPFPEHIAYIPTELEYVVNKPVTKSLFEAQTVDAEKISEVHLEARSKIIVSGNDLCNDQGLWGQLLKHVAPGGKILQEFVRDQPFWILIRSSEISADNIPVFEPVTSSSVRGANAISYALCKKPLAKNWLDVIDYHYGMKPTSSLPHMVPPHKQAVDQLRSPPVNWTFEHDEDLCHFLQGNVRLDNCRLGSIRGYVDNITVSSFADDSPVENLTDGEASTYWESNGAAGEHWIRFHMKKWVLVKQLFMTVDSNDDNYMPHHIVVSAGEIGSMTKVNEVTHNCQSSSGVVDILVLHNLRDFHPVIEIKIKDCKDDGIDTRIHGIKLTTVQDHEFGLSHDRFKSDKLVRFPKLENFGCDVLYRRALLLQRFIALFDSVLSFIIPDWKYTVGSNKSLQVIRQLLILSEHRIGFVENCLRESQTKWPSMPKLYINRRMAAEHRSDPSKDPAYKHSIFQQIYEGLLPKDNGENQLTYRWSPQHDQWWECKFVSEGIIDQGGGFRDSLCDLSEELCPSDAEALIPVPFFIRTPNHYASDTNIYRGMYIPNPSCKEYHKYEWLGQLMGACLRGRENLVLSLPIFVWKKLTGEVVTWNRDFATVDDSEVKLLESMKKMDEEAYQAYFANERTWTTVLSNKKQVSVHPPPRTPFGRRSSNDSSTSSSLYSNSDDGDCVFVSYEDRKEYAAVVEKTRMNECRKQISAIRRGLLKTVPRAILDLLAWQELERRICGNPEITVDALKRSSHYEDVEETDTRVVLMWAALTSFSNEDRSRFLRFVTGRRRLPASLYICPARDDRADALPESSTCSNTLYLPRYSSEQVATEKLRYASYNCIAIDTDMSPWDE